MMKPIANLALITVASLNLCACSFLGGYFPNKEKDYQFSTELPPLTIPAEILNKSLEKKPAVKQLPEDTETVAVIGEVVKAAPVPAGTVTPPAVVTEPQKAEKTHVELIKFVDGDTRLQINKPVAITWRLVGKALTRKGLEITARDQANAEFTVQYDPNASSYKDESLLDEFNFVFSPDQNQEKPHHIKLLAHDKLTELVVLNEKGIPLADGSGLSLLKLLLTTMESDSAEE
jgi:outer membrane protein assembly factor BamC